MFLKKSMILPVVKRWKLFKGEKRQLSLLNAAHDKFRALHIKQLSNSRFADGTAVNEKGISLVVALVILFFLTILAVTAARLGTLDEKIVYNFVDNQQAFLNTETARLDAENYVSGLSDTSSFINDNGLYQQGSAPDPLTSTTWQSSASRAGTTTTGSTTPRYFIEYLGQYGGAGSQNTAVNIQNYGEETGAIEDTSAFRMVERGTGNSGNAESIIESFYMKAI